MPWAPRATVLALTALLQVACARSVTPTQPPVNLTDVLHRGAAIPLADYINNARQGIKANGEWAITREEDERTGGSVSHTTIWVERVTAESRVNVRLDFRDGLYGLVITGSQGLPLAEQDCVLRLNENLRAAIGLEP